MYTDLAGWFHLLTSPHEYEEEAELFLSVVRDHLSIGPGTTLLELGSGGGNMASHYKRFFKTTLTDISEEMLAVSREINPDCDHIPGDMRDLRLGREFNVVFIHDALDYLTTEADLRAAIHTAFIHTRSGGIAVLEPDCIEETFRTGSSCGGNDGDGRAMRYLEWVRERNPDGTYFAEYAMLLREDGKPARCIHESHLHGLFSRATWMRLFREAGFEDTVREIPSLDVDGEIQQVIFVARRPEA
jgi:trans-aconitate methyltransferase